MPYSEMHPPSVTPPTDDTMFNHPTFRPELDIRCLYDLGSTSARIQEIEAQPLQIPPASTIRFDLIEITAAEDVSINPSIPAKELWEALEHTNAHDKEHEQDTARSRLRLIFVEDPNYADEDHDAKPTLKKPSRPRLNDTAIWLHLKLGIPITFFQYLSPTLNYRMSGNCCFTKKDTTGQSIGLEGFYQNSHGLGAGPAHIYYSYSVKAPYTTTYLVYNVAKSARDVIIQCARMQNSHLLLRPLVVDVFLADDLLQLWNGKICTLRTKLILYESELIISNFSMAQSTKVLQDLHTISQDLQIVRGNLLDLRDKLQFFLHVRQSYLSMSQRQIDADAINSITESLSLLTSRIDVTGRWANNYYERASIRINLFFNLTTQADSHTNLSIARMTTKISVATQKDSSSMITIAAVTMFFLPGSFVSALFSMHCCGHYVLPTWLLRLSTVQHAPQWWLFPSVTIPLTAAVFAVWLVWQRRRSSMAGLIPNIEITDDEHLIEGSSSGMLSFFEKEEKAQK
ncbi:hypothetical protein CVT24_001710 [Panaeolus cyanescens]|uniref:Uncharacterized protein n=1 Tax=Panaeolus cyanescens TaxID=181874 RepID=A0A409YFJ5_9AGAR|nr:hypothetical protein CVT24_001710 [Panaeolus cyanescens]